MRLRGIPVVTYHCVGRERPDWVWNHLITPVDVFEGQMRLLKEAGWQTISLAEMTSHVARGSSVPEKPVVLTFDDGYLDNYVYAFPILKKYGHRAVIWVSTDFVDPLEELPPTLEDVWRGRIAEADLDVRGYLSWEQMRHMVRSGAIEIQSHAKTHTWYFSGPRVDDFHRPAGIEGYAVPPWLAWNLFPDKKHLTLRCSLADRIPYGTPIYEHERSLVVRRYFEDADLNGILVRAVHEGAAAFFGSAGWRARLLELVAAHRPRRDRLETEAEYVTRVRDELTGSRRQIEMQLGTGVEYLCWPGDGHNDVTLRLAAEAGYVATTTHYDDPVRRNAFGDSPREINRIGNGSPCVWRGFTFRRTDPEFFLAGLASFRGDRVALWRLRQLKLRYLLRYRLRGSQ